MKNKLFVLLIIIFVVHLLFRIFSFRESYTEKFDAKYWKTRFEMSQWSTTSACRDLDPHINPKTCVWDDTWYEENKNKDQTLLKKSDIGDDGLYTYAGWEYIRGHDPTTLNAEVPPVGKYLIGLSIMAFGNQNIFALLSGLFALLALYLLNVSLIKDKFLAFLPVMAFSFEPLFYSQLRAPYLDLLYLVFLLLTFLFVIKRRYFLSAVFLGLMAGTKASTSSFVLVIGTVLMYLVLSGLLDQKRKKLHFQDIKKYLISLPVAGVVFLLTYIVYFLKGNSIMGFLGVQKWIINFYAAGAKGTIAGVWQMIFTGKYSTWFGTVEQVGEWHIGWVVLLLFIIYELFILMRLRKFDEKSLLLVWTLSYLVFLSSVPVWPRYLLLLLPFMYNLSVWRIAESTKWLKSVKNIKGN